MRNDLILDLADCTEFRQTLLARPPRIVHGTVILLALLLGAALWQAQTDNKPGASGLPALAALAHVANANGKLTCNGVNHA